MMIGDSKDNWIIELGEEAIASAGDRKALKALIKKAREREAAHRGEALPAGEAADFRYQTGLKVLKEKDLFLSNLRFPGKIRQAVLERFPEAVQDLKATSRSLTETQALREKAEAECEKTRGRLTEVREKLDAEREAHRWLRDEVRRLEKAAAPLAPLNVGKAALFIATNGGGMGHLTCSLSVARRMKKLDPSLTVIFLTTSLALQAVHREGFVAYALPSPMIAEEIPAGEWNRLLEKLLRRLFEMYRFSLCVFDGATPYASILKAVADEKDLLKVWLRYYFAKTEEIHEKQRELEQYFDLILMPADVGVYVDEPDERHLPMNSLVYLDRGELLPRETVRRMFSVPEGNRAVYLQLGAGNINDISGDLSRLLDVLKSLPDVSIILGESIIGAPLDLADPQVTVLRDYPNSRYFAGFDLVIIACGYSSFHEALLHRVPALFLPNAETKTDDQVRRARVAQEAGFGRMLTDTSDEAQLRTVITELLCGPVEEEAAARLLPENGAWEAARVLTARLAGRGEEPVTDED